jgi:bifunctional DNA-binding transcriptional regulator/antitoxin component of YhaV-PrlF toxin-antitoxin module
MKYVLYLENVQIGVRAMNIQRSKMVSGGRLQVPVEFRRALGMKEVVDNELHVRTLNESVAEVQAMFRKYAPKAGRVSDELIAERRREAERE